MTYDFDKIIDRRNTNSIKYDLIEKENMPADILPMWVADMDFQTAPCIRKRLAEAVEHGIFGYSDGWEDYFSAVSGWYSKRFGWEVKEEWLVRTPGVVYALATAVRALTKEGDAVLINQPVYYPFARTIRNNNRTLINSPLRLENGHYEIDFEDMERKITENHVKMYIMCSPHNPVGRVWTEEELRTIGDICIKHNVIVVSDEIHSDFVRPGYKHHIFASLSEEYADNCIICTAPSKTFNIAGLQASNIFIPNETLRKAFEKEMWNGGYSEINQLGLYACQAAYEGGAEWLDALKDYIYGNYAYLKDFIETNIPQIKVIEPEGTYLIWLDCRALGMTADELDDFMIHKAKLWLDAGSMFGEEGAGFERINIACPRTTLKEGLERLKRSCPL